MKKYLALIAVIGFVFAAGCASNRAMGGFARAETAMAVSGIAAGTAAAEQERMIVKRCGLTIAVDNLKAAADSASAAVKEMGGFVQNENQDEGTLYMSIRVPAEKLDAAMDRLAKLGDETGRTSSKDDVTMQVIDSEAVLKNKKVLRDRLRQLANQAKDVKDIIAVESELSRVQGELDSMEAMLKTLKGQVAMSGISLTINKKITPGPLGWVFMGIWWVIEKLFVW
jgi:hypothetical protein